MRHAAIALYPPTPFSQPNDKALGEKGAKALTPSPSPYLPPSPSLPPSPYLGEGMGVRALGDGGEGFRGRG